MIRATRARSKNFGCLTIKIQRVGDYPLGYMILGASHIIADRIGAVIIMNTMKIVLLKVEFELMMRPISVQVPSPAQ